MSKESYEICKELGEGAYGKVKLLKNINTNSYTALKEIDKQKLDTRDLIQIMNEIIILKSLDNIFINKLKNDVDEISTINIHLEYESGGDLHTIFTEIFKEKLNEKEILFYIAEICLGVEYIHSKNIIHRDLKLENILISSDGHIKICDFGFAIISERALDICGTVGYLSPEILTDNIYTSKLDIWCIGIITYELAYSKNPFEIEGNFKATADKTLSLKYTVDNMRYTYINNFLQKLLVLEPVRYDIEQVLHTGWLQTINQKQLKNGSYIGKVPYIPEQKKVNNKRRLRFINELLEKSNEYTPVIIFDVNDNFKCVGYNIYFKTIFRIKKEIMYLDDFLSTGKNSKCINKIKDFILNIDKNNRFLHTKYLKQQDSNGSKIKCGIDSTFLKDEQGKLLLYSKITPLEIK